MNFSNCYEDLRRADAYATLEFANTYYLAYRDLPAIIERHVTGTRALDFGCGTGRSTRFLRDMGFAVSGVDTSEEMLRIARSRDPAGDYQIVPDDKLTKFASESFDLIVSLFTLDNIPQAAKSGILCDLARLVRPTGTMINVVSSPEIYTHEWASFTTKDFPENAAARSGDLVRIIVTDHPDRRPVEDILCTDEAYQSLHKQAGLQALDTFKPLARGDESYLWINETQLAPWVIYVLRRQALQDTQC